MRIAMICTEKLPVPPIAGGAVQLYIDGITPYLSGKHEITVFSIQYPGLPERETINNIHHIRLPGGTGTIYLNSLKAALKPSYDLIHVFNRPRYVVELMDLLPGVRMSLSLHNEMFHPEKISDADGLKCIEKVEFINTVSKYIADTVMARFPSAEKKLRVVYSGVDTGQYKPVWSKEGLLYRSDLKNRLGLQGYKVVLFVGRLSNKKGVHVLLEAMRRVMLAIPKTALVVIGSKWYGSNDPDDYTKSLQTFSTNLSGPIRFTGFLPPNEVSRYYCLGDVFVCASQWNEPLARVHYEAMAAGLPIITTNRGGNAEVISGYGNGIVISDYFNPVTMSEQICHLLTHPAEALQMGGTGRLLAERNYTWERVAAEVFPDNLLRQWKSSPLAVTAQNKLQAGEGAAVVALLAQNTSAAVSGQPSPLSQKPSEATGKPDLIISAKPDQAALKKLAPTASEKVEPALIRTENTVQTTGPAKESVKFGKAEPVLTRTENTVQTTGAAKESEKSEKAEPVLKRTENTVQTTGPAKESVKFQKAAPIPVPPANRKDRSNGTQIHFGWNRNVRLLPDPPVKAANDESQNHVYRFKGF